MEQFKKILCVLESETDCRCALARAVALAESNQAQLKVIAVTEPVSDRIRIPRGDLTPDDLKAMTRETGIQRLESLIEPYRERTSINIDVLFDTPFLAIVKEVLRGGHDLVIKCPESQNWTSRFFASDDMHLLRKCPCPVWLVKQEAPDRSYQRVLAAVDVRDDYPQAELATRHALNMLVMEIAGSLAVSEFAELHVAHAWEVVGESALRHSVFMNQSEEEVNAYVEQERQYHARLLDQLMEESTASLGQDTMSFLVPRLHLVKGPARMEIPVLAKQLDVDCLVMGTVARTGIRGFIIGNTAESILEQIDCSVVAIKPPGFETPVTL